MSHHAQIASIVLLAVSAAAQPAPFPAAPPGQHGFSADRLQAIGKAMQQWVEDGDVVGAEILIIKDRHMVMHEVAGWRNRESDVPMTRNTICRIRSMTKPFVGTAIQILAERESLSLDDTIAKHIPSFDNDKSGSITIRQLLRHEGGFEQPGYPEPLQNYGSLREAVDAVGNAGPPNPVGEKFLYSDAGSATLGAVVAAVSGMPAEEFIATRVIQPLGLPDTFCNLTLEDPRRARVSCTYIKSGDGFEKYWDSAEPQEMQFFRASGGMYSTPLDYARFLTLWMDSGVYEGDMAMLSSTTVRDALVPSAKTGPDTGGRYGQHWAIWSTPPGDDLPAFGHSGSDGTLAIADPTLDLIVCYFTQSRGGPTLRRIRTLVIEALDPEATSLGDRPLFPPPMDDAVRAERLVNLEAAVTAHEAAPEDLDATIWLGRRTAYLGRYREAIDIYTRGLEAHGDEPHLLRHRGHRHLSRRNFSQAIADLERAAELIKGQTDEVEPDGIPNSRNTPTSTLHSNIFYHLGLAKFLSRDFASAAEAYAACMSVARNADMLCATTHWYYMTLQRLGKTSEAAAILEPIRADMDVIENHGYHQLLLMYKGECQADELLASAASEQGDGIQNATVAFGVGHWHLMHGRTDEARQIFERIANGPQWSAFGHIAAEVEVHAQ